MVIDIPQLTELMNRVQTLENKLAKLLKPKTEKEWYSLKEAAAFLNVSYKTAWRLVKRGLLKRSLGIRHVMIPADSLREYRRLTIS